MRRLLLGLFVLFQCYSHSFAQQYPHSSNYYSNPFFYNPASIAESGKNEVNLFYRKQWVGFNDAPTTQGFNLQLPLPKNLFIGIHFIHDRSVLLKSSTFEAGIGYMVQFDAKNSIKFGITTGLGTNNFEFDMVEDYTDPAIYKAVTNRHHISGRFGVVYRTGNFALGAALPQIFKVNHLDTAESRILRMDQFSNYILSARYKFQFAQSNTSFEPIVLYRKSELVPGVLEVGGVFGYKDLLHAGAFYKINTGVAGILGVNITEKINFSYAYEHTTSRYFTTGNGNHELNLRFRFGRTREVEKVRPKRIYSSSRSHRHTNQTMAMVDHKETQPESINESKEELSGDKNHAGVSERELDPNDTYWHYVVIGAFKYRSNSQRMITRFQGHQLDPRELYIPSVKLHYVYVFRTKNLDRARKVYNQIKENYGVSDIWIYHEEI
jgi:type IX secretion system PorP/SprF family membrane protein